MNKIIINLPILIGLGALILFACSPKKSSTEAPVLPDYSQSTSTPTQLPTEPQKTTIPQLQCVTSFEHKELKEPYQRNPGNQPRYTFSTLEIIKYYKTFGIKSFCIPVEFGDPFLNIDWVKNSSPSGEGTMISLGFDALYHGSGWGDGFLVFATYDFLGSTEFDRFASPQDWKQFQTGTLSDALLIPGTKGFSRIQMGLNNATTPVYKTYVFPKSFGYVALVFKIGDYRDNLNGMINLFRMGTFPVEKEQMLGLFDQAAKTMRLK